MNIRKFLNKRAIGAGSVVTLAVALLLIGYLVPIALLAIADANMTGSTAVVVTLFQTVLPLMAIIGVALKFLPRK